MNSYFGILASLCMLALPTFATAGSLTFSLENEFTGGSYPSGETTPWITVTLDDTISPNSVRLTMAAPGLVTGEFVSKWYFNLDPSLDPTALVFTPQNSAPAVLTTGSPSTGAGAFKAGNEDGFDICFEFSTAGRNGGAERLTMGESIFFDISMPNTVLTIDSFLFLSDDQGFMSAAHVQGIDDDPDSGWLGGSGNQETPVVPVPSSLAMALTMFGAMGCVKFVRRRGK